MSTEIEQLIVKSSNILKKAKIPDRHSFFQIEKFIIGKEPTTHAQLWQIIREIESRMETFDSLQKQIEDAEDNLELLDIKTERFSREINILSKINNEEGMPDLEIQEREINIRKVSREKKSLIRSSQKANHKLQSLIEELSFLVVGYEKIIKKYGDLKPFDDEESQREMWNEKLLEDFNLRVILQRPLDPEFIKTVMCLGDDAPVKKHVEKMMIEVQREMIETKEKLIENKNKRTNG